MSSLLMENMLQAFGRGVKNGFTAFKTCGIRANLNVQQDNDGKKIAALSVGYDPTPTPEGAMLPNLHQERPLLITYNSFEKNQALLTGFYTMDMNNWIALGAEPQNVVRDENGVPRE